MRFEITLISLLESVFGAICAGELFPAQLTPHWVYCREPAILGLELHRVLNAAAFEMPSWEEVPRLTCTEPYDPTGPFMFARNKAHMKRSISKTIGESAHNARFPCSTKFFFTLLRTGKLKR